MKIKNYKKFIIIYETGKEIITLGDTEVKKHKFHQYKSPISINDADISKIVVSNRVRFGKRGFKYFIGYEDGKKVRTLCVVLSKCECISFLIKNEELLEKYNEI